MFFTFGLKEYGRNNEVVVRRGSTVIILNPFVTHFGVSCAESYSAELQNYVLLLLMT